VFAAPAGSITSAAITPLPQPNRHPLAIHTETVTASSNRTNLFEKNSLMVTQSLLPAIIFVEKTAPTQIDLEICVICG
jgi:hypothetical protein